MIADIPDYIVLAEKVSTIAEGIGAQATNCPGDDRIYSPGRSSEEGRTMIAAIYALARKAATLLVVIDGRRAPR
jgi:hypothetical protein